jgi:predicted DNA-binding transcriptional regulator YafY
MPTNKNASIRYQALDKCFRDKYHRYYMEDLIDKCEEALLYYNGVGGVSRRQIFEDIKYMESEAGWSADILRKKDGKKVYYRYEDWNFTINSQPLTDEEARQLETVILSLSRFRGMPSNEWIDEVISKLEYRFHLKGDNQNVIGFEQNENLKGLNYLNTLLDAATNHQVLRILYRNYKFGGREISFVFHPYYVKEYNNRWFVFGLDQDYNGVNNIALDRIVSIEVADDVPFIMNENIDFDHYFDDIVGVSIPKQNPDAETITLRFTKNRFPYVTSKPIHSSQETVDEVEGLVTLNVRPNWELDQQILSYGKDVEVVSPKWYRDRIAGFVEEIYKKYFAVQEDRTQEK